MVMILARAFTVGILGMIPAIVFAAIANYLAPNEHLLVLQGQDAFPLVVYWSAFLGGGFGAVVGAISAAAELIATTPGRDQPKESQGPPSPPAGRPG